MLPWGGSGFALADTPAIGFYEVAKECREEVGSTVFLNRDSDDPAKIIPALRAQGKHGEALLTLSEGGETQVLTKAGKVCPLKFVSASMKVLGVCSDFQSHRGDSRKYPANSLEAFESALDQGFSGFELDVQLANDQTLVVNHDDNLRVSTDCRGKISQMSWEQIQECPLKRSGLLPEMRLLSKKAKKAARMPALGEVFDYFKKDPRAQNIMIDIKPKGRPNELIRGMMQAMSGFTEEERKAFESRITFIAKDYPTQSALRDVFPSSHIAYESDESISGLIDKSDQEIATGERCVYDTYSLNVGADYNWIFGVLKVVKEKRIFGWRSFKSFFKKNQVSNAPRRVLGWTLNHKKSIKLLRDFPIDDVLTDFSMSKILNILYKEVSDAEIRENIQRLNTVGEEKFCQNDEGEKG